MLDLHEHGSADTGFGREAVAGPTEKLARGHYLSARDHVSPLGASKRLAPSLVLPRGSRKPEIPPPGRRPRQKRIEHLRAPLRTWRSASRQST
jgi:hypothetical protein